ncbi:hypothetical protein F5Y11DRAFT_139736 [Daldinia sp. FL1419]|nr:hypothetical protein F5Y11DRAFT_139736 [Daldinia sp. FL1419]
MSDDPRRRPERDTRIPVEVPVLDHMGRVVGWRWVHQASSFHQDSLARSRSRDRTSDARADSPSVDARDSRRYGSTQGQYNDSLQRPTTHDASLSTRVNQWMQTQGQATHAGQQPYSYTSTSASVTGPSAPATWADPNTPAPSPAGSVYNRDGSPIRSRSRSRGRGPAYPAYPGSAPPDDSDQRRLTSRERREQRQNQVILSEDPRRRRREERREERREKREGKQRAR